MTFKKLKLSIYISLYHLGGFIQVINIITGWLGWVKNWIT